MASADVDAEPELFGTETMAELCARQGRLGEAVAIYRRLIAGKPDAERLTRWTERCRALERAQNRAGPGTAGPLPEAPRPQPPRPAAAAPPRPAAGAATEAGEARPPAVTAAPAAAEPAAATPPPILLSGADITEVTQLPPAHEPESAQRGAGSGAIGAPAPGAAAIGAGPGPLEARGAAPGQPVHSLPMVITQPVRSGQVVYARHNDLIVLAPVNPGGQVVADGNVHVYAPLRGRAIAGAQGAAEARIFCQRLEAELLAINGIYLVWEDIPPAALGKPAQVLVRDGQVMVLPL